MHELGIMQDVLDLAVKACEKNDGRRVTKITLLVGVLSGVLPNYMQSYFDLISKGTIAEGSELVIEVDPAVFVCRDCGGHTIFERYGPDFVCGECGGANVRLISGKAFKIISIAII